MLLYTLRTCLYTYNGKTLNLRACNWLFSSSTSVSGYQQKANYDDRPLNSTARSMLAYSTARPPTALPFIEYAIKRRIFLCRRPQPILTAQPKIIGAPCQKLWSQISDLVCSYLEYFQCIAALCTTFCRVKAPHPPMTILHAADSLRTLFSEQFFTKLRKIDRF